MGAATQGRGAARLNPGLRNRNSYRVAKAERPLPNPPQGEGVPPNRLKHSRNGLPPLGEGRGGALGVPGWGSWRAGVGLLQSSCFCTGASRNFFTANGGFFYRGYCWRHAPHDGGDGGDDKKENLFSDGRHHRHHQGEAASSAHGFLCLFQPLPNPPQREGVPLNRLKHSRNGLPPLV